MAEFYKLKGLLHKRIRTPQIKLELDKFISQVDKEYCQNLLKKVNIFKNSGKEEKLRKVFSFAAKRIKLATQNNISEEIVKTLTKILQKKLDFLLKEERYAEGLELAKEIFSYGRGKAQSEAKTTIRQLENFLQALNAERKKNFNIALEYYKKVILLDPHSYLGVMAKKKGPRLRLKHILSRADGAIIKKDYSRALKIYQTILEDPKLKYTPQAQRIQFPLIYNK